MDPAYALTSLFASDTPVPHRTVTLKAGPARERGTVLGAINVGGASSAAKAGGNTGNGALTLDAVTPVRAGAKPGVYTVRAIAAAANSGTFRVEDPSGAVLGDVVVGATFDDDLKFVIADGATDFIVGDGFDITVAGSALYEISVAAAADGSQNPGPVLAYDVPGSETDRDVAAYFMGDFVAEKLILGAGHTADTVEAAWRAAEAPRSVVKIGAVG